MSIIVCPLSRVPDVARDRRPSHVVSLLDPGTPFPLLAGYGADRHFCLEIHDIEEEMDGYDALCGKRMRRILDFVGAWGRDEPILIHCYAGISRSTATAYITACAHNPEVDEEEIALADAELGRNGRMTRAIEKIGRGASWLDIGEALPFTLSARFGA
jgi:predicted protein tyrosine phosphatase